MTENGLDFITSPTLLLDEKKCRKNIRRMVAKANRHGLDFRPHFKTHQSADIGEWFREAGVKGITVSSVSMANYFSRHGWKEITIAFPVNPRQISDINELGARAELTLLVSDKAIVHMLQDNLEIQLKIFLEIDTGSNRSGFKSSNVDEIDEVLNFLNTSEKLQFSGFYSHPGHSYSAQSQKEIQAVHTSVLTQCKALRDRYGSQYDTLTICIGDTPCCSAGEAFTSIDQISPGNFVFYDVMQTQIGSCRHEDIAVALACPVVAKYPSRQELIIHAGAIHLSKEKLTTNGLDHYGLPVLFKEDKGWTEPLQNSYLSSLSQEHGVLKCSKSTFKSVGMGDLIGILPVHSCLTADLMMGYRTLNGEMLNHIRKK